SGNLNTIADVKKRSKKLIEIDDQMFSPLLFYGTALAIQNNYEEAITVYENAMQFESSQPNLARLYHNLLVSYLTTNRIKKAVALVKKLPLGIKTYFNIINLIHSVEQSSGEQLIQDV
ncbi:MAG: tetratricopeptide repeat protein, partial [Candidatus Heimdallarchaeota archaeon]|nr:tetratricopeptide repeat protein [Candidatus Heimdallarchaeota archaeon]